MKQVLKAHARYENPGRSQSVRLGFSTLLEHCLIAFAIGLFFVSCQKQELLSTEDPAPDGNTEIMAARNVAQDYVGLHPRTAWEIQQARAATARYRHISHALADGYENIAVVIPNMGHHYLKPTLLDATFDPRWPELLVYNPDEDGNYELVAVEYAVPITLSPNAAPEGFTGNADVWNRNEVFGLWLLHAWVWKYNPMGVFHPTNSDVHVH